ncbi:MAG: T9SS type A sorting domain-containing protein [Bacteroidetes bacterium]|nr:T9SS type A sorting domain-containing protein [Bacteroidota bacterium]
MNKYLLFLFIAFLSANAKSNAQCDTVTNLSLQQLTSTSAKGTWDSVANATQYEYCIRIDTVKCSKGTLTSNRNVLFPSLAPDTTYYLCVRSYCSTVSAWACISFKTPPVPAAVKSLNSNNNIKVYPTATSGETTIEIPQPMTSEASVYIFNTTGQQVMKTAVHSGKNTINISQLSQGTYIIKIVDHNVNYITKLQKL